MRTFGKPGIALALAAVLSGCGSPQDDASPATDNAPGSPEVTEAAPTPADTNAPPPAFAACISCHAVTPGRNGVGPSLHGIYGGKAATVAGYAYSAALKDAGLTWDAATLDAWLANPKQVVPGTKMVFFGMPDAARRKQVIDYLATLK